MKPTLYLMMGLPGAGKTTIAKLIEEFTGAVRLSSDEQRLQLWPKPTFSEAEHQKLYDFLDTKTEELLRAGKSVIYDANLNRLIHRQQKYGIAEATNAKCILIVVSTPAELAHQRAVLDGDGKENRVFGNLKEAVFQRLKEQIEWPNAQQEPHKILLGTAITAEQIKAQLALKEN